jgi:hypothetical protein
VAEPSLFESWCAARDRGDLAEARRLVALLQEMRAGPPKQEDPDEHLAPSRSPGSHPRRQHSQKRSVGKR